MHSLQSQLLKGFIAALVWTLCVWGAVPLAYAVTDADIQTIGQEQAQDQPGQATAKKEIQPPSAMRWLAKTAVALGLVLGLLWLGLWALKRFMPQTTKKWTGGPIEIMASRSLGQRRSLMLVRVQGRTIFLGVTPHAINSLAELEDPADWNSAAEAAGLDFTPASTGRAGTPTQRGTTGIEGAER